MRILHAADLHLHRDHYDEARASIETILDEHDRKPFDLFVIAGDIWDGPVQNSAGSRFKDFLDLIRRLADRAPVAIIYGTPSHDTDGSLEVFESLQAKYDIRILRPGKAYFLGNYGAIMESDGKGDQYGRLVLFGVPEPNKKWLLAGAGATGKDEADAAVRQAMRNLFLGLGGLRREYPDLPCVLLYHGQVSGARSGTGFKVEGGSGLAVSRDDLSAVGADYIALGDIHEPQQIPDLPAYYPGSIYPLNWGETHKAGANVVEIEESAGDLFAGATAGALVSRLAFPHPVRSKISLKASDPFPESASGLVWVEITAPADEAKNFDTDVLTSRLVGHGAELGSRVTLCVIPTETVRAGEISEKKTLREKVQVWAENSSLTIPESVLEKADELEREAAARGGSETGAYIRMTRLRLRGAKGIWKNQRLDEIDLDLEARGPGVLALVGANGKGKTTILENLHPWPQMLTRDGTLKSHFRLRDSFRDLYFTDDRTGIRYRALVQINAATASGSAEYFLYADRGQGFEPLPGINGRLEPYEAAVRELFGSLEMYLRTAFQTQRPTKDAPDLAEATKGQRKALFAELSGIDYLEAYRQEAKDRADTIESEIARLDAILEASTDAPALIARLEADIAANEEAERRALGEAKLSEARVGQLTAERQVVADRVAELERKAARKSDLELDIEEAARTIAQAEKEIQDFQSAAEEREHAERELATIRSLEREAAALQVEKSKIDEANRAALTVHAIAARDTDGRRRDAQAELDARRREAGETERSLAAARARLSAPIADHCPTCAQLLPAERREHLIAERAKVEHEAERLAAILSERGKNVADAQAALAAIVLPEPPEPVPFPGQARMMEIAGKLASHTAPHDLEKTIRAAAEAAVRIEAASTRMSDAEARRAKLTTEAESLALELAGLFDARTDLRSKDFELAEERECLSQARSRAASARAFADSARRNLEDARARLDARTAAEVELRQKTAIMLDWRVLERATGPDGIQALELDALAPSIAAVANRLLSDAYGSRYAVRFDTTRIGGKGARAKQIEDFLVQVLDSETGEEQEIATLSGGEGVWIRRALYDAFATIRAQNCGVKFLTIFADEADGALDPEARMRYLRMLEAAHAASGRYQTILITHSSEIQAMLSQVIDVCALGVESKPEEAAA